MKKVAGKLRLDLSQYRDLEAFAQFGSELDPETQKTLNRGERLVEMLKQKEREPLEMADQVAAIYSGTGGFLDRIKTERVGEFLRDLKSTCTPKRPTCWSGSPRPASSRRTTRRRLRQRSPRSSTTSAPTSTSTATRWRPVSPTASRRAAPRPADAEEAAVEGAKRRRGAEAETGDGPAA